MVGVAEMAIYDWSLSAVHLMGVAGLFVLLIVLLAVAA